VSVLVYFISNLLCSRCCFFFLLLEYDLSLFASPIIFSGFLNQVKKNIARVTGSGITGYGVMRGRLFLWMDIFMCSFL
jgi:hypothetical protein